MNLPPAEPCAVCGQLVSLMPVGGRRVIPASRYWLGEPEDWQEVYCGPACSLRRAGERQSRAHTPSSEKV